MERHCQLSPPLDRFPRDMTYAVIYAGQAAFAKILFRVSTMGAISVEDVQRFIAAISEIVRRA